MASKRFWTTIEGSAAGFADRDGRPSFKKGGPEGVFQLSGITLLSLHGNVSLGVLERMVCQIV